MHRGVPALLLLFALGWAILVHPPAPLSVMPRIGAVVTEPVVTPDLPPDRMRARKALSGHAFTLDGRNVTLEGVQCPDPGTEAGRRAKALLNQFLHTNITCELVARDKANWFGSCKANGRDVARVLIDAGLCNPA